MINAILNALKALEIKDYSINEVKSESVECFFVRRHMDLKRRTEITDYSVTVFRPVERDGRRLLGSCALPVYPGMSEAELREGLSGAYSAASFAANPDYELLEGGRADFIPSQSAFAAHSLEENMKLMAEALFAPDKYEDAFINSAELFAVDKKHRIVTSRGIDVSYGTREVSGEYVIQCVTPSDVETHHRFSYREPETEAFSADVEQAIVQTRDRAGASKPPKAGEYTLILSGDNLRTLLGYYLDRSNSSLVYQKYSSFEIGQNVQGGDIQGDALSVTLKAVEPYSAEGVPMRDRVLMENGVLRAIHGGVRFARYLGIEPTGDYGCIYMPSGSVPLKALRSQPCLHVVSFSDFQMDSLSGCFGGEIRLAYLCDGNTVTPVTGGSVNGNIIEAQKNMTFSCERYRCSDYDGPLAVSIKGVNIAGC